MTTTARTPRERATAALDAAAAAHDAGDTKAAREAAKDAANWAWVATTNRQAAEGLDFMVGHAILEEQAAWMDADAARTAARETKPRQGV